MSRWRLVLEARDTLKAALVPALSIGHWLRRGRAIAKALRVLRSGRPMQLSQAATIVVDR